MQELDILIWGDAEGKRAAGRGTPRLILAYEGGNLGRNDRMIKIIKIIKKLLTKGFYSGILIRLSERIASENVIILKYFRKIKKSVDR